MCKGINKSNTTFETHCKIDFGEGPHISETTSSGGLERAVEED